MGDQAEEYSIEVAEAKDMGRVRALLPMAFSGQRRLRARVAKQLDNSRIIGAAAWWLRPTGESSRQAAFFIRVANPWMSRGVATSLVRGLMTDAREADASELVTGALSEEGGIVDKLLTPMGFDRRIRLGTYEVKNEILQRLFTPLYERYKARHKMPAGARLVSLDEAPLEEVRNLVLRHLGGLPLGISRRLREGPGGYDRDLSVVLMMDGKVMGVLLARIENGVKVTDVVVVAPEMRGSWANLFIKQASLEKTIAAGIEITRYSADVQKHPDTAKQGLRTGAKMCGHKVILGIDL